MEVAIAEVDAFMAESGTRIASWWLSERSTPDDVEELLLAGGLERVESDYLHAGMVLTSPPPLVPEIEARAVATFEEFREARLLQRGVFSDPNQPETTDAQLAEEYAHGSEVYAAWIDGRMASAGRAVFTRVGVYLMGGATAPWARGRGAYRAVVRARWDAAVARGTPALGVGAGAMSRPILERLGFVQAAQFRRVEQRR